MKARSALLLTCLVLVIIIGIGSRIFRTGFSLLDKYFGDALYAAMFYLILSLLWRGGNRLYKGFTIMAFMAAIESFQLTQIPMQLSRSSNIVLRIIAISLGTEFGWLDILSYLLGITGIILIDQFGLSRIQSGSDN